MKSTKNAVQSYNENTKGDKDVKKVTPNRVRELRKGKHLTQSEFADSLEKCNDKGETVFSVESDTISKVERGERTLSAELALRIQEEYDVSMDWLYCLSDSISTEANEKLRLLTKFIEYVPREKSMHEDGPHNKEAFFASLKINGNLHRYLTEKVRIQLLEKENEKREIDLKDMIAAWNEKIESVFIASLKQNPDDFNTDFCLVHKDLL